MKRDIEHLKVLTALTYLGNESWRMRRSRNGQRLSGLLEPLPLLQSSETIDEMVAVYVEHKVMPTDATGIARHLAPPTGTPHHHSGYSALACSVGAFSWWVVSLCVPPLCW